MVLRFAECGCATREDGTVARCPAHDAELEAATAEQDDYHGINCRCPRCIVDDQDHRQEVDEIEGVEFPPHPENGPNLFGDDY